MKNLDSNIRLTFVRAESKHLSDLAEMNRRLIQDEGHRNKMLSGDLRLRMEQWLKGEYTAILFDIDTIPIGYALFRRDPEYYYLRQFFIEPKCRRKGIGTLALQWLNNNVWHGERIRVEVLTNNENGVAFWRAAGFHDYCLTLEIENSSADKYKLNK